MKLRPRLAPLYEWPACFNTYYDKMGLLSPHGGPSNITTQGRQGECVEYVLGVYILHDVVWDGVGYQEKEIL